MPCSLEEPSNTAKSKRKQDEEVNSNIMSTIHVVADALKEGNVVLQETNAY